MIISSQMIFLAQATETAQAADASEMSRGLTIAVAGMLIVAVALSLISLFIAAVPKLLAALGSVWPEVDDPHSHGRRGSRPDSLAADDGAVIAAIGYVLHTEFQKQLSGDQSDQGGGGS